MSFSGLLIHTVEVYRRREVDGKRVRDRFGQELSINPRQHEIGGETLVGTYPCRAYMKSGGLLMEERMVDVFQRIFMLYTDHTVDIREDDAVRVYGENGHVIIGLAKVKDSEVKYAMHTPHHAEFTIWEQAGPGTTNP